MSPVGHSTTPVWQKGFIRPRGRPRVLVAGGGPKALAADAVGATHACPKWLVAGRCGVSRCGRAATPRLPSKRRYPRWSGGGPKAAGAVRATHGVPEVAGGWAVRREPRRQSRDAALAKQTA